MDFTENSVRKIWSPSETNQLIKLIKRENFLWNPTEIDYKNEFKIKIAFQRIGEELNRSSIDCRSKWNALRAQFRQCKARVNANIIVSWKYFEKMEFLNSVMAHDGRKSGALQNDGKTATNVPCTASTSTAGAYMNNTTANVQKFRDSAQIYGDFVADSLRLLPDRLAEDLKADIVRILHKFEKANISHK